MVSASEHSCLRLPRAPDAQLSRASTAGRTSARRCLGSAASSVERCAACEAGLAPLATAAAAAAVAVEEVKMAPGACVLSICLHSASNSSSLSGCLLFLFCTTNPIRSENGANRDISRTDVCPFEAAEA